MHSNHRENHRQPSFAAQQARKREQQDRQGKIRVERVNQMLKNSKIIWSADDREVSKIHAREQSLGKLKEQSYEIANTTIQVCHHYHSAVYPKQITADTVYVHYQTIKRRQNLMEPPYKMKEEPF